MCCRLNVYQNALILRNLPCPEKFLVKRLTGEKVFAAAILLTVCVLIIFRQSKKTCDILQST